MTNIPFSIPDSVFEDATRGDIRAGVDALLLYRDKLPPDLRWEELGAYYDALAAAHRVMFDRAKIMHELWNAIWLSEIPASWVPLTPDEQVHEDDDMNPIPRNCHDNDWYGRKFKCGSYLLCVCISLEASEAAMGFGIVKNGDQSSITQKNVLEGFDYHKDTKIVWQASGVRIGSDRSIDLASLIAARETALQWMKNAIDT